MVQDSPRSQPMATVYVSRRLPDPVMAELARRFTLIGQPHDRPATREELLEAASQADALAVTLTECVDADVLDRAPDRKSTRLNSSHGYISYAVFCLKKKRNEDGH